MLLFVDDDAATAVVVEVGMAKPDETVASVENFLSLLSSS
jgi:hypothetical protein